MRLLRDKKVREIQRVLSRYSEFLDAALKTIELQDAELRELRSQLQCQQVLRDWPSLSHLVH